MTAVAIFPGTERGDPFDRDLRVCRDWPVPQLEAVRIYDLIALARRGIFVGLLAEVYGISEREAAVICLHHRVGPKGGSKYFVRATSPLQPPPARSFITSSQPVESEP